MHCTQFTAEADIIMELKVIDLNDHEFLIRFDSTNYF